MGGIVFLVPGLTVISVYGLIAGHWDVLIPVAVALAFGALGVVDDLRTLVGKTRSAGLSPAFKWVVQIAVSLLAAYAIQLSGRGLVRVPFLDLASECYNLSLREHRGEPRAPCSPIQQ